MMKKLLFLAALMISAVSFAQNANIGIIGGSTSVGWDSDLDMTTTDGVVYTYNDLVITVPASDGGVKFRQDDAWITNWGGTGFPSGTAALNGGNIPAVNGTYNVTFNLNTLEYNFQSTANFEAVTTTGIATITMQTTDGINYYNNNYTFETSGGLKFVTPSGNAGGTGFPAGTATIGGADIPVVAGTYNISFNKASGAYSFDYVRVSIIGDGAIDWNTDVPLNTTDGITYTLNSITLEDGPIKFRVNNSFDLSWGGTEFPSGTGDATPGGPDLTVTAGTYSVTFNRVTAAYSFGAPTASTAKFAANTVSVYPNPSQNNWNFTANTAISTVEVIDVTGKTVLSKNFNTNIATVNAAGLTAGIYFARINTGTTVQVIKVVKK